MQKSKKIFILFFYLFMGFAISQMLSGCATAPVKEALPTYDINGTTYYSLIAVCESRNISWQYDEFAKTVTLTGDSHRINLKAGDNLVLVDGSARLLNEPVDIYQGTIVVPSKFKEQVIDVLFKTAPSGHARSPVSLNLKKVVVDAGHGGNDPGAIGKTGLREKDVNLDIAKRLASLLRAEGVEVVMTRSTDRFIPLDTRVQIANNSGADLFVSIHSNANRVRSLNGFEVYYVANSVNDTKRAQLAARSSSLKLQNAYFASNSLDLKTTIWDMIYTDSRAESIELSRQICRAIDNNGTCRVIGIKGARYEVLRGARMPAVLIEIGFVSNGDEERKLRNSFYREKLAESIEDGLRNYSQDAAFLETAKR